jgi:hypothetical protein
MNPQLAEWRHNVIDKMIQLEVIMNAVICQKYLGGVRREFYLEVLYDELFPFGLRRSIVEKILGDEQQDLRVLGSIRNLFAHCGSEMFDKTLGAYRIPLPKDPTKSLDFEARYQEFEKKYPVVRNRLETWFRKHGGELTDTDRLSAPPRGADGM